MDRNLIEADRVLSEHFTAAIAGKAQRYEPMVTGGESSPEEAILAPGRSRARAMYLAIESVLAEVPDARRVIRLVYAHGTDAISNALDEAGRPMAGKPTGLVVGKNNAADPFGLLRFALTPSWGHGSLLRLAVGEHRALRAFGKRYPGQEPTHHAVLDFLAFEAGRGDASARMLAEIRNDSEATRDGALALFGKAYAARKEAAQARRTAAEVSEVAQARKLVDAARSARNRRSLSPALERVVRVVRDLLDEDLEVAS